MGYKHPAPAKLHKTPGFARGLFIDQMAHTFHESIYIVAVLEKALLDHGNIFLVLSQCFDKLKAFLCVFVFLSVA